MFPLGIDGRLHEVQVAHPRNFNRVLERQEKAFTGAVAGVHVQKIGPIEIHRSLGDFVIFSSGKHRGQSGFARTIRAHDGVHFSGSNLKVKPLEDGGLVHLGVEVFDGQH